MDGLRACVHCGICLPQCPTYRVLGEEMDSPRGRVYLMRAAAEGRLDLTPRFARHLDLCLGCRSCETACPSGVPFGELLEASRGQLVRHGVRAPASARRTLALALGLFSHPNRLGPALVAARLYQRSGLPRLVRPLRRLEPFRKLAALDALLPPLPARPAALPEVTPAVGRPRGRVGLLTGCVQRFFFPEVNRDTANVLAAAGYEVVAPSGQGCCGALHLHAGRIDEFRAMAGRVIDIFDSKVDMVITNAAGCGSALKEYAHWLPGEVAETFARTVRDVSEVLARQELPLGELPVTVAYQDACHLIHGQRLRSEPRELLRRIPGLTLVELKDGDLCCGSAGLYNLLEPEIADELGRQKAERIRDAGAPIVASGNPGCIMQVARHCRSLGVDVEVLHPVSLLARALREPTHTPMKAEGS